jgi:hypothetical protein
MKLRIIPPLNFRAACETTTLIALIGCTALQTGARATESDMRVATFPEWAKEARITSAIPAAPKIYVSTFSHNEDPFHGETPRFEDPASESTYWAFRDVTLEAAEWLSTRGIKYNFQTDWNFINGVKKYEIEGRGRLSLIRTRALSRTGGKNLIKYLSETLAIEIDSHTHENPDTRRSSTPYHYADVANLILDVSGVKPTGIVGGQVINEPHYGNWPQYKSTVYGTLFPTRGWKFSAVMGGSTANHADDILASGIWTPKEPGEPADYNRYFEIDPSSSFPVVGNMEATPASVEYLRDEVTVGRIPRDRMLTASVPFYISKLVIEKYGTLDSNDRIARPVINPSAVSTHLSTLFDPLSPYLSAGTIEYVTFTEALSIWRNLYDSTPFLCKQRRSGRIPCDPSE